MSESFRRIIQTGNFATRFTKFSKRSIARLQRYCDRDAFNESGARTQRAHSWRISFQLVSAGRLPAFPKERFNLSNALTSSILFAFVLLRGHNAILDPVCMKHRRGEIEEEQA